MNDVSRETPVPGLGPTPEAAERVFGVEGLPLIERYAGLLATEGVLRGLIGPRETPRLWDRHLLNCGALGALIPGNSTVADIGSGAGLPGIPVAIARPDVSVTLIEPLLRRTTFLEEVVEELGLSNVEVVRGKAELLHGQRSFDVVTSRAVAPLERLLTWSMPLVGSTGLTIALKGDRAEAEITEAASVLARLGCAEPVVASVGADLLPEPTTAVLVEWDDPSQVDAAWLRRISLGPASGRTSAKKERSSKRRRP